MAALHRLIVALVVFWLSGSAFALVPQTNTYTTGFLAPVRYDSESAACTADFAGYNASQTTFTATFTGVTTSGSQRYCNGPAIRRSNNTDAGLRTVSVTSALACPSNSTASGGSCACTSPFVENAAKTACEPATNDCVAKKGSAAGTYRYDGGYGAAPDASRATICQAGTGTRCIIQVTEPTCQQGKFAGVGNSFWTCRGMAFYTGGYGSGAACSRAAGSGGDGGTGDTAPEIVVSPNPDKVPEGGATPTPCAAGTFEGTINGVQRCVKDIGSPTATPSPQNGSSTTNNANGSTTTQSTTGTTTCAAGKCTTTNTTTVVVSGNGSAACPSGTVAGTTSGTCTGSTTTTTEQGQRGFCAANPKSTQCTGSESGNSSFGGNCASGFKAVSDDAVLNAMAEETFRQNCKVTPDEASTQLAAAEMVKTGDQTLNSPNNSTVSLSQSNFDTSNALGGASACPIDRQVQVWKWNFTLRMSSVCSSLEMLGAVMLAFSFLLGARIVARG